MTRRVAIVGAAHADLGRVDDISPYALTAQAARRALADSGLSRDDVDGFAHCGLGTLAPIDAAEYLGLGTIKWFDSTQVGGGSWEIMAAHAVDAIALGHVDVVMLAYGSTTRADLKKRRRTAELPFGQRGPRSYEAPMGHTLISKYAMAARRHMHEYGTTLDQLAEVAVSARYNAGFNPDAYYRDPLTIDEVHESPMLADPFTKYHCCIRSDGGCGIILAAEDRIPDTKNEPIWVLGTGESFSHFIMSEWDDFTTSAAKTAGELAFGRAGVTPEDIDICQIYDAYTYMLMVTLEDLGFCKKGEGGAFVEKGRLRLGGDLPTNTDGGGLSACHPGMRGLFLMVEAALQLRGQAGERQVPDAKLACVSGHGGWFCANGTMILGTE